MHEVTIRMSKQPMSEKMLIDIDAILASKAGKKARYVPRFLVSYLKKIAHQEELNGFLENEQDRYGVEFIEDFFACFIKEAHASLDRTPDLLPALKQAGVIDSGGAGYNRIIEGMISALDGNILVQQQKYEQESVWASVRQ